MSSTLRRGLAETSSSGGKRQWPLLRTFAIWSMTVSAEFVYMTGAPPPLAFVGDVAASVIVAGLNGSFRQTSSAFACRASCCAVLGSRSLRYEAVVMSTRARHRREK